MRIRVVRVCGVRARKSCVSAAVYFAAEFVRRGVRRDDVVKDIIFIASRGVEFFFFVGGGRGGVYWIKSRFCVVDEGNKNGANKRCTK